MSQKELADKAHMSSRMIQKYESGAAFPRENAVSKLADALEVSSEYLLFETDVTDKEHNLSDTVLKNIIENREIPDIDKKEVYSVIIRTNLNIL